MRRTKKRSGSLFPRSGPADGPPSLVRPPAPLSRFKTTRVGRAHRPRLHLTSPLSLTGKASESPVAHSHTRCSATPAFLRIHSSRPEPFGDPRELFFSFSRVGSAVLARRVTKRSGWTLLGKKEPAVAVCFFFFYFPRTSLWGALVFFFLC